MRPSQHERSLHEEIQSGIEEAKQVQKEGKLIKMKELVHEVDAPHKALTGRRAEQYAMESLVSQEELFPKDGHVLNIGDPWQTLDVPGVVSLDYEFGEEAEFAWDTNFVRNHLEEWMARAEQVLVDDLSEAELAKTWQVLMEKVRTTPEKGWNEIGNDILQFAENIGARPDERATHGKEFLRRELWYTFQRIGRGCKDVWLMANVIEPEVAKEKAEALRRGGFLSEQDTEKLKRRLVNEHRFVKKTKEAEIVQGTFPHVEFEEKSFDRMIASWSLSTHMFPEMTRKEFALYWDEINRLLKRDGVCYLWPVYRGNEVALSDSLLDYFSSGGDACIVVPTRDGTVDLVWIDDASFVQALDEAQTLAVFPRHATRASKKRVISKIAPNWGGAKE